jgi:hypothetical protein
MGIFDFVKDAGKKIGLGDSKNEEAATEAARDERLEELQQGNKLLRLIRDMNQGVENPRVEFDDGVATVYGKAPSQAIKENTILVIGNVQGVARVDDRMEVVEAATLGRAASSMLTAVPVAIPHPGSFFHQRVRRLSPGRPPTSCEEVASMRSASSAAESSSSARHSRCSHAGAIRWDRYRNAC